MRHGRIAGFALQRAHFVVRASDQHFSPHPGGLHGARRPVAASQLANWMFWNMSRYARQLRSCARIRRSHPPDHVDGAQNTNGRWLPSSPMGIRDFDDHLTGGRARPLSGECVRQGAERKYLADGSG